MCFPRKISMGDLIFKVVFTLYCRLGCPLSYTFAISCQNNIKRLESSINFLLCDILKSKCKFLKSRKNAIFSGSYRYLQRFTYTCINFSALFPEDTWCMAFTTVLSFRHSAIKYNMFLLNSDTNESINHYYSKNENCTVNQIPLFAHDLITIKNHVSMGLPKKFSIPVKTLHPSCKLWEPSLHSKLVPG